MRELYDLYYSFERGHSDQRDTSAYYTEGHSDERDTSAYYTGDILTRGTLAPITPRTFWREGH